MYKEDNSWNPITCIYENGKYSVNENSVIKCDEMLNVTDSVSTNVTSSLSKYFHNKIVQCKMDRYML